MTKRLLAAVFAVALFAGLAEFAAADTPVQPVNLRCEYLAAPLGIDVVQPRLSWQIGASDPATRDYRQTAYQVVVASTLASLGEDRGDLWDTGRVISDQSVHVVYRGKPLTSRAVCYWKVRIWDQNGLPSEWSEPSTWSMGLLKPSDWKAQWIGIAPTASPSKADPWFRGDFSISGEPVRALAYVASLGFHELYVNGQHVDDRVLAPSISDFSKHVRYVTYDLSKCLRDGANTVVLWCAPGWAGFSEFHVKDKPLVMAQIEILQPGGSSLQVASDATWKTHPSPLSPLGNWAIPGFGGESYDARLEIPGWGEPGLDTSHWDSAAVFTPHVRLSAEMVEPNHRVEILRPVAVEARKTGVFRIDMGRNYAGWVHIGLKGKPGEKATLQFAERPDQVETYGQKYEYVFNDSGEGFFCQRFNHAAARWVTISGPKTAPDVDSIYGFLISTDCAPGGSFKCSNELLNRIYDTTVWTYRSLSLGGYTVDCPHRERMGYGGDAHATMETAMTNFGVGAFYTKWLGDWRDVQKPDGDLPYTAPTYFGGGGPAWSGICITLPWQLYLHYGDRRILETCYPMMQRWLDFLKTKAKDHQLQPWGGVWDFLGDWVPPDRGQDPGKRVDDRSTLMFNNCYYVDNVATVANVAEVLGKRKEAAAYRKEAAAIAAATHKAFFQPDSNSYANGTQLYEAMPVLVGVTPPLLRATVINRLADEILVQKKGHIDTGIHGTYYLIKTLLGQDRNDLVFTMVNQKTYPGWGYMLDQGATTLWEEWNGDNSRLHSSFVSVGSWFIEGVAGIQLDPAQPGYKHFFIRPGIVGNLTSAKAELQSLYGKIESNWVVAENQLTLTVEVPINTSATVFVPTDDPLLVSESERPPSFSRGVKPSKTAGPGAVFEVGSGHYTFRAHWRPSE
ncbi:MAG: family 78 glycoside hydrolase catalytic domain [Thermoguttaceae bacterium]|jgi:hypothetical protein